ncbi:UDP-glucose 4-epimerase family protein [Sedimenticola thiotaurini]|uniref:NAD-dependent dehydratase n=1 Tax=Sedimenticola thiotaurini TaxID=1543721 RepID=A0A0F7JYN3_9GAMM|nr:SDR family oxidoreductase [Sedimenticola thiotaurini]AKH20837.1 NAD-dependent dehydratase [Sedimenticola thiotaurini]
MRILLTGATGFVGRGLLARLSSLSDIELVAAVRDATVILSKNTRSITVAGLYPDTDWQQSLDRVSVVIHAAARVHVMRDSAPDPLFEFRRINVEGTLNLARQAVDAGVQRFIFVSSIKVNGEGTTAGSPYFADTAPSPSDPYAISKLEAERGLLALAEESGMEVVIIRPPLVYGPGVKANFLSMMRWLYRGVPLPLGAICNRRSLVALENLVDLIVTCIDHPAAGNQVFLVSDGEDLSTTELLRRMGLALGKPARLLAVPGWMLEAGGMLMGKRVLSQRLCGSLQVNIDKTCELLNWMPPVSVEEALKKTANDFLSRQANS